MKQKCFNLWTFSRTFLKFYWKDRSQFLDVRLSQPQVSFYLIKTKSTLFFPEKCTQNYGVIPYSNTFSLSNSDWSKFRTNFYFIFSYVNLFFTIALAELEVQLTYINMFRNFALLRKSKDYSELLFKAIHKDSVILWTFVALTCNYFFIDVKDISWFSSLIMIDNVCSSLIIMYVIIIDFILTILLYHADQIIMYFKVENFILF